MDDNVGAVGGAGEAVFIPDVADEETETEVVGILLLEPVLFEFIAGKNPNGSFKIFFFQQEINKRLAERSGPAGQENSSSIEIRHWKGLYHLVY